MNKKIFSFVVIFTIVAALAACAAPAAPAAEAPAAEAPAAVAPVAAEPAKVKRVGMLWDTTAVERRVIIADLMQECAKVDGYEVLFQAANADEQLQATQGEAMLSQGVDLLVLLPVNMETASSIVNAAKADGIPVIAFDRMIMNSTPDIFISFDNEAIGDVIAQYAVDRVPAGNYALINGDSADNNAVLYREGFYRVLQPFIDKGDIKVVFDQYTPGWDGNVAVGLAENALTAQNNDIQVFLSQYDGLSNGIIQALKGENLSGVLVTGQDAELTALQRIVQGEQTMTVWKSSEAMAKLGCDSVRSMLAGTVPETDRTINNGTADIPSVLLGVTAVDKDNMMETIVAAGAYKMEDIYANIPKDQWPK